MASSSAINRMKCLRAALIVFLSQLLAEMLKVCLGDELVHDRHPCVLQYGSKWHWKCQKTAIFQQCRRRHEQTTSETWRLPLTEFRSLIAFPFNDLAYIFLGRPLDTTHP